jgi:hypothetical protein
MARKVPGPLDVDPPLRSVTLDLGSDYAVKNMRQALSRLAKIQPAGQGFVVAQEDGTFVPVIMLAPTQSTPDWIHHIRTRGVYVMIGLAK